MLLQPRPALAAALGPGKPVLGAVLDQEIVLLQPSSNMKDIAVGRKVSRSEVQ